MSALTTAPALDKTALIGGCLRLPIRVDAERLRAEMETLPAETWRSRAGRVAVHRDAAAVFLRGYAPREGDKPIEDRPVLDALPYMREVIETHLGAAPLRCLLAQLCGGGVVTEHADQGDYFRKTVRIHVPVVSNPRVAMVCAGACYTMAPGEVWALNNSTRHAVWNADPNAARTHIIVDYVPTPALLDLLRNGERGLGRRQPEVDQVVRAESLKRAAGG